MLRISLSFFAVLVAASPTVWSQETIYVTQGNPTRLHAFTFDGSHFVREDLDPSSSAFSIKGGLSPYDTYATHAHTALSDRFLLVGASPQTVGLDVVDPFTGLELPRVHTSAIGQVAVSPDQNFAYVSGTDTASQLVLSVVDLRPASATFLQETASVPMLSTLQGILTVQATAMSPAGNRLYVLVDSNVVGSREIVTFALSDPGVPVREMSTAVPPQTFGFNSDSVTSLRAVDLPGGPVLLEVCGDLRVLPVLPDGSIGTPATITSPIVEPGSPFDGGTRSMKDVGFVDTPGGPRALATAFASHYQNGSHTRQEILVVDLAGTLADDPTGSRVLLARTLPDSAGAPDQVGIASSGLVMFALSPPSSWVRDAALIAVDVPTLLQGSLSVLDGVAVEPGNTIDPVFDLRVRPRQQQPSPGPTIQSVDSAGAGVLVNDAVRPLTLHGTALGTTSNVFSGLDRLTLVSRSETAVEALAPAGLAAGAGPLVVVTDDGAIGSFDAFPISNPASVNQTQVAVSIAGASVTAVGLPSESWTPFRFDALPSAEAEVASPDGRFLYVASAWTDSLRVYALVPDAARGYSPGQVLAEVWPFNSQGWGARLALSPDGRRLFVASSDPYRGFTPGVVILDTSTIPPTYVDADGNPNTTDAPLPAGISRISILAFEETLPGTHPDPRLAVLGLALSPDGQWLYVARSLHYPVVRVHVDDDLIAPADRTFLYMLVGSLGYSSGGSLAATTTNLYYASGYNVVDVFSISGGSVAPGSPPTITLPDTVPSTRTVVTTPDQRFVYVGSSPPGLAGTALHVIDPATSTVVATLATGSGITGLAPTPDSQFLWATDGARDSLILVDARPGSPTLHQVVGRFRTGVWPAAPVVVAGLETPVGDAVAVTPATGLDLTYSQVLIAGNTSVTRWPAGLMQVSAAYQLPSVPAFFKLTSTATFSGTVDVCLPYDSAAFPVADLPYLRLLAQTPAGVVDSTLSLDATAARICGRFSALSEAVVAARGPDITVSDAPTVPEGSTADFVVSLSRPSSVPVTADFATSDGTATAASGDYNATSGTLTFAPGETTQSIPVVVNADLSPEPAETFFFNLTNATGAGIADDHGQGTIAGTPPTLTINSLTAAEGNSGVRPFVFTVSLSWPSLTPVTVKYATANGSARVPSDYLASTGTLTFAPGQTSKTVNVMVVGDRIREAAEVFYVRLSAPTGATIAAGTGRGVILNDD